MEKSELREHLSSRDTWMRGLYMLLFAVIYSIAELVLVAVVVFQFLARLITGDVNRRLLDFGQQLSRYLYDMLRFFTFNSEEKPYPFAPWNKGGTAEAVTPTTAASTQEASSTVKRSAPRKRATPKKRAAAKKDVENATDGAPAEQVKEPSDKEGSPGD